jgi:uncharacterized membrane protein YphA (DoxX/SURF4 family)
MRVAWYWLMRLLKHHRHSRAEDVAIWAGQALVGSLFVRAGTKKLFGEMPKLEQELGFPKVLGPKMTRFIGASEVAGGIGSVLPAATRIAPWLTPLAAGGLAAIMLLASGYHLGRREFGYLKMPIGLGLIAATVANARGAHNKIRSR